MYLMIKINIMNQTIDLLVEKLKKVTVVIDRVKKNKSSETGFDGSGNKKTDYSDYLEEILIVNNCDNFNKYSEKTDALCSELFAEVKSAIRISLENNTSKHNLDFTIDDIQLIVDSLKDFIALPSEELNNNQNNIQFYSKPNEFELHYSYYEARDTPFNGSTITTLDENSGWDNKIVKNKLTPYLNKKIEILTGLVNSIKETMRRYNSIMGKTKNSSSKLVWKKDTSFFFLLFFFLTNEGFLEAEGKADAKKPVSDALFNFIEVSQRIDKNKKYDKESFYSEFKGAKYFHKGKPQGKHGENYNKLKELLKDFF